MMSRTSDSPKCQRIQVFARCRPMNVAEKRQGASMMEIMPEMKRIEFKDRNTLREYTFDQVFSPDSDQVTVYKSVAEPLIHEVLLGYSCTIFAYGQTGTGKTYTMEGERSDSKCSWKDDPSAGIIPRSLHQLYEELEQLKNAVFSVKVSFCEIYNEEVYDLLSLSDFVKLRLCQDPNLKDSVKILGLEETVVKSKDEVYTILERGAAKRHTAETKLNVCSSRSHAIFTVAVDIVETTSNGNKMKKSGKLNLVDLAGSENVGRSGAVDTRAREAGNINQSLLTLGRVITALIEKQAHVPYRESKLTRILQYSLGGHAKTSLIAAISPALCNLDETISTLEYAAKAKSININPELNKRLLRKGLIKDLTKENERLRMENEGLVKDLAAARSNQGYFVDAEIYESNIQKITVMDQEIKTLKEKNLKLQQEAILAKRDMEELHAKIRRIQTVAYSNEDICEHLRDLSQKHCTDLTDMVTDYNEERIRLSNSFKEDQDRLYNEFNEYRRKKDCFREMLSNELQLLRDSLMKHFNEQSISKMQRANDLSQDLKSVQDSWVSVFDDFLTQKLQSLLNTESALIEDWITNNYMRMEEKVNLCMQVLNNQTSELKTQLGTLKDTLEKFFMEHDAAICEYALKVKSINRFQEMFKNMSKEFAMVNEELNKFAQFEHISKFENNASQLRTVQQPLDMCSKLIGANEQEVVQLGHISADIKPEEFLQNRKANMLHSQVTCMLDDLKKSQINNYKKVYADIEACNSEDLENVQTNNCIINGIASISDKIDEEYQEHKIGIRKDILDGLVEAFDESEKSYANVATKLTEAISEKGSDMEKFISETFVKDVPTGATPQPRASRSPRYAKLISPYRSWHGFDIRNRIDTPLKENDESNCTDDSSFLNSQNISFVSEVYDSDEYESDSAMEPEAHFDDNESDKENKEVFKLNRRKSVQFTEPTRIHTDQHLQASPLSSRSNQSSEVGTK